MSFTALYVHVPFCLRKCAYCAFYSIPAAPPAWRDAYLRRLDSEFRAGAELCEPLRSVYVGGGTPTLLEPAELERLLGGVRRYFPLAPGCEVTVECNPESLSEAKAELLAGAGVSRISLGAQTFHEAHRRTLGRLGTTAGIASACALLRRCGIRNLGLDLVYAIPGQTLADWIADLQTACGLGVQHLSTYELTVEEGSRLAGQPLAEVAAELAVAMWEQAAIEAGRQGLLRYEVSNLARPGFECRHNLDIWLGGTYVGCGPAACSFDGTVRRTNPADFEAWLAATPASEDRLAPEARAAEILAFGLRTTQGWTATRFQQRTGFRYQDLRGTEIADLVAAGLLEINADQGLRPTPRGLLFADTIAERLLAESG